MQLKRFRCLLSSFLLSTILSLTGCGGGSSSPFGTTGQAPKSEVLYANGTLSVMSFAVDPSTGVLTKISTILRANGENGETNIIATPSGAFVYSGDQMQVGSGLGIGIEAGISGYSIGGTGSLDTLSGFPLFPNIGWPYLAMDPQGKFLYTFGGIPFSLAGFTVDSTTGMLTPIAGSPFSVNISPQSEHIVIDPSGKFLYASSLDDSVYAFTIDSSSGLLTSVPGSPFATPPSQPQSIAIDPSGKFLYTGLINDSVAAFAIDRTTGVLTEVPGSPFQNESGIFGEDPLPVIDPSGRFLYTLNLDFDTFSGYAIDSSSGALTPLAHFPMPIPVNIPSGGQITPQGPMVIDPAGKFLYLGCTGPFFQGFEINPSDGRLSLLHGSPFLTDEASLSVVITSAR